MSGLTGWRAEDLLERFPESTGRFEAGIDLGADNCFTGFDFMQRASHPAGAMIGLKGHTIVAPKLPSCGRGVDSHLSQVRVSDLSGLRRVYCLAQLSNQFRRLLFGFHRPAAQAGT